MPEIIKKADGSLKRNRSCCLCGGEIEPGELYSASVTKIHNRYSVSYSHTRCVEIAVWLNDMIGPDDFTADDFRDGCETFCEAFVCPSCNHYDDVCEVCCYNKPFCMDKIHSILQTHNLVNDFNSENLTGFVLERKDAQEG